MTTITDYSGRMVDIECLQTVKKAEGVVPLSLSFTFGGSRIVTGMQKLAQRFTVLLFSQLGNIYFDQDQGTTMLRDVLSGGFSRNAGYLQIAVAFACSDVVSQMRAEEDTDLYGALPTDERLVSATLVDFEVDLASATLYLKVQLTSVAGATYVFVLPTDIPRT